jgi:hypothetical protein
MQVGSDGLEPEIDGNLPMLLGDAEDWFFPPIPWSETDKRTGGETVIRERDGTWDDFGFYDDKDRSAKGYFDWASEGRGVGSGKLMVTEQRSFRSDDGSRELVGSGRYTFDLARGVLDQRSFQARHVHLGVATTIVLQIVPTDPARLPE